MDVISDALRQVRLSGAVLFRIEVGAPWAVLTSTTLALPPPATHMATFHVVLDGECWVGHQDEPKRRLTAGEAVILPRTVQHFLGDAAGRTPADTTELIGKRPLSKLHDVKWGGDGPRTRLLCGFLGYEPAMVSPLFDALPTLFVVRLAGDGATPALDPLLAYAEDQIISRRPGSVELRVRMAELLFIEALRRHMALLRADEFGWLAGVRDPLVGRALSLLHTSPGQAWTMSALAQSAASSRSVLTERFQTLLGEPPMQYLTNWRMRLAARRLRDSRDNIAQIAAGVGYGSSVAFQRAFKRCMHTTPAAWRRSI